MRRMLSQALAPALLCFLQPLLGIFIAPLAIAYMDVEHPLERIIYEMRSNYLMPTPHVLFLGRPELYSPLSINYTPDDPTFLKDITFETKVREPRYGIVVIDAKQWPMKLSQLSSWGNKVLVPGGWLVIFDFDKDHYVAAFRRDP